MTDDAWGNANTRPGTEKQRKCEGGGTRTQSHKVHLSKFKVLAPEVAREPGAKTAKQR